MPIERYRGPKQSKDGPEKRAERGVVHIESKIPLYQKNIVPDDRALIIDGYDSQTWNTERVLKFENNLFIASKDGRQIAGFTLGRDAQGETVSKIDMTKFPVILSVLKDKFVMTPVSAGVRAEEARKKMEYKRPEATIDGSIESVREALMSMSVESGGQKLAISWPTVQQLSHNLRTNNVPTARFAQYVSNIRDHAALLSSALRSSSFRGSVTFDGQRFIATDGNRTLITTATHVLRKDARGNLTTLDNKPVRTRANATTTEYGFDGRTEIHRRDGGLAVVRQAGRMGFYDGRNDRALLEKTADGVTVNGPYGSIGMRPRGDIASYAREIANALRTPEAIAAFVTQFYEGQDYKNAPENKEWLTRIQKPGVNPVRYVSDDASNTVQNWKTTLERGAGDCEDFALLSEELLRQAGIHSFVMMVDPTHYETVYFEKAADGKYHVCTLGLRGFNRSVTIFVSPSDAVRSLWQGKGSGAEFALSQSSMKAQFGSSYPPGSPGVFALLQPGNPEGNADMIEYSDAEYFTQFVRK